MGVTAFINSFNGKYWGGYAYKSGGRNYFDEARRNITKQADDIKDVEFYCKDYKELEKTKNCLYYLDPPYFLKTGYKENTINHEEFWNWVRELSKNNIVYISEENAPDDFECVWQKDVLRHMNYNKKKKSTEKLFKIKSKNGDEK